MIWQATCGNGALTCTTKDYYKTLANKTTHNPQGPETSYDSNEPYALKRVSRGGSFLCHDSYCSGYRNQYADENHAGYGKYAYWI
jgi:hypothetical protein